MARSTTMARSSSSLLSSKDCILVFVCVILLSFNSVPSTCSSWGARASVLEESESWRSMSVEAYLQAVNVPGVKTFQLSDGDVITCVNITDQVSSPRDIQLAPSVQPRAGNSTDWDTTSLKPSVQTIISDLNEGCPPGTIPTRKHALTSRVQAAGSVRNYFRKHRDGTPGVPDPDPPTRLLTHEHSFASLGPSDEPIKGVEVFINVWSPFVNRQEEEFSLAQLWLMAGWPWVPGNVSSQLSTMEVGWQVFGDFYGDFRPRLFVYWTADSYRTTGCYNLDCPGFVQVSNKVVLGGSFSLSSITDSTQYEIKLRIFKDPESGNWWLQLNDENVGYWPDSLFENLKDHATTVQWGGEIVNNIDLSNITHTVTDMGSGQFASAGYQRAAFQRNLQYVDSQLQLRDAWAIDDYDEVPGCYNSLLGYSPNYWGSYMYFGGPGYNNASCV